MSAVPGTLKVGVHIRIGDSGLSNALKKQDERYPLGCAPVMAADRRHART